MSDGRYHDLKELHNDLRKEPHESVKKAIHRSIDLIKHETGAHRSMREKLVEAHKKGDWTEVKDIHDYVEKHEKYKRFGE